MKTLFYSLSIIILLFALNLAQFSQFEDTHRIVNTVTIGLLSVDWFQDYPVNCHPKAPYDYCHAPVNTELFRVYWGFRG